MANKTVDQLATLSGIADNDYLVMYDTSEAGTEKLKKVPYSDFMSSAATDVTVTAVGITIDDDNDIVEVTGSDEIIILHAASTATKKRYDIKNTSAGTITVSGTDMIDDGYSISIPSYESRTVVPTGSKWIII